MILILIFKNYCITFVALLIGEYEGDNDNYFFLYDKTPIEISDITTNIAPNIVT